MKDYFRYTRAPWPAFAYTVPLLLAYQVLAFVVNLGQPRAVINGADGILREMLSFLGVNGWLAGWLVVAVIAGLLAFRADVENRGSPFRKQYFPVLIAESAVYAVLFGGVVYSLVMGVFPWLPRLQMGGDGVSFGQKLAVSLGAGLYEELVFRLLLTGGLIWLFGRTPWKGAAIPLAVLIASFIFSAFHYVGPYADAFRLTSFSFRFMAGIVLAGLFAVRGFAVAAWTHALYDVFLLVTGHA